MFEMFGMFGTSDIWNLRFLGCGTQRLWDVLDVECWKCVVLGMWNIRGLECLGCVIQGMWDIKDVGCCRYGCLGMWEVTGWGCIRDLVYVRDLGYPMCDVGQNVGCGLTIDQIPTSLCPCSCKRTWFRSEYQ